MKQFLTLSISSLLVSAAFAADPALVRMIHPDSKFVAGVDVDKLRGTPFGQFLLNRAGADEAHLNKIAEVIGMDPRRDLRQVIVSSSSASDHNALVLVSATYDEGKLVNGIVGQMGAGLQAYQGTRVLGSLKTGHEGWLAFLPGVLAFGPSSEVKQLIERRAGSSKAEPSAAGSIQSISSRYDAWMFSNGSPATLVGNSKNKNIEGAMNSDLLRGIESMAAGVKFGANVEIGGEATVRSAQDAAALIDVVKFFATMAQSNGGAGFARFVESLQMKADGRVIRFSATATEQEFERLFGTAGRMRGRPVVLRH